jgi:hypothetical protein
MPDKPSDLVPDNLDMLIRKTLAPGTRAASADPPDALRSS